MDYPQLARYADELFGDRLERIAADAEVSRATCYNMKKGKRARVENYEKIALAVGRTRPEQREIFKNLMRYSGYLDLLPEEDSAIELSQDEIVLAGLKRLLPELYDAAEALLAARRRAGRDDTSAEDDPVQDKAT